MTMMMQQDQQAQTEAAEPTVPVGYKQTEMGLIPEDWGITQLGNQVEFVGSGKTNTKGKGSYPLYGSTGLIGTCSHPEYEGEAILIARVGANAGRLNFVSGQYGVSDNTIIVRLKSENIIHYFKYWLIRKNLNTMVFGSGQPLITGTQLKELVLPMPQVEEQTAIANVLSDIDALLGSLEALVAKKQAIKTATMQQLLTGRTRLPQFALCEDGSKKGYKPSELGEIPEDWEVVPFGSLFESKSTQRKKLVEDEEVSFVGMQDVSESAKLIQTQQLAYSEIKSGLTYFERGDVLVAKITPCFENGKGCHTEELKTEVGFGSTEFHVLKANQSSDSWFIYFWTTQVDFRIKLDSEMVGSAGHRRVPLPAITAFTIPAPNCREEQTAIATILSDMDEEIQALEQRLAKTRDLKQGMMQQLLTGKIRLVKPLAGDEHHAG